MSAGTALRRRVSLRARLIVGLVALIALVCLVIGALSLVLLRTFLLDRVDQQLQDTAGRSGAPGFDETPGERPPQDRDDLGFLLFPGQNVGTLGANLADDSTQQAGVLGRDGSVERLTDAQIETLSSLPADGVARSVNLKGLGDYRVLVVPDGGAAAYDSDTEGGAGDGTANEADDAVAIGLPLNDVQETLTRLGGVVLVVSLLGLTGAGAAGTVFVRRSLRPLDRVAATATRVSELPLDRGEVALAERVPDADADPHTEVGQVGAALNRLLGHVTNALEARQASETRVRQFVADASHELRTPLASIRGYAELTRRRGALTDPDTAHALGRVESEAARMTTLVEDLLLLARLDSGRPLEHGPVDLTLLLIDTVSDARAAGPDHVWALDLPADAVTVTGDGARLHQVLANLLANARTHTPPGTTVTATLRTRADVAVVEVADDGPGIPTDQLPDVFERFSRGDASRSRAAGSTGLGLAIVAAVVQAHAGTVAVVSPGPGRPRGTTVTVTLPA